MAEKPTPRIRLLQLATGYWMAQAVHVAAKLGIADLIQAGVHSPAELAVKTKTHPHALYRLLRALASLEVFAEDDAGNFHQTELSEQLLDRLGSMRAPALMMGDEHYVAWAELQFSVETGKPAFDHVFGKPIFEYLSQHPEPAKIFDAAMTGIHGPETPAMVDAYDFSGITTLVDIGGGNGTLLSTVLRKYPALYGIIFDLENVIQRTRENIAREGLAERCQCVAGNFFEKVIPGGDAYLMRHIIHDWNDEQAAAILRNCRQVMPAKGRLILIEGVIKPGNEPNWTKFLDLNMMVLPGGLERTEAEYRQLLASTGFRLDRIVPTRSEVSILEARPV